MTLTDTQELFVQLKACATIDAVQQIIAEYGEDCTAEELSDIFRQCHSDNNGFVYGQEQSLLCGKVIACPQCHNTSPDTILANSTELLCGNPAAHFGCCSCGTQFVIHNS